VTEERRAVDPRIEQLVSDVKLVAGEVKSIREMLISEPEASPLGRMLKQRSVENRQAVEDLREEFEKFRDVTWETWKKEQFQPVHDALTKLNGAWLLVGGIAVVLGIFATYLAITNRVS
jgi:ribonuclease HI